MLDVRRLHVLREVARQGSLSGAATTLGYTQPAISRQIAVLESEVGVQLLRPLPQGVVLTDAGRLLVERSEDVFLSLMRTEEELRAHAALDGGRLRMATFASAAATVMPVVLARFRARHPAVELIVTVADPVDSLPQLRAGELDLALCNHSEAAYISRQSRDRPGGESGLRLDLIHLFDDPMYVALPVSHALAEIPQLDLGALAQESWMIPTTETCPDADLFSDACASAGMSPRIAFQYDNYAALLGFVSAGVGIAMIPDMVARSARPGVVVRDLDPPLPPRPVVAAMPRGYRSPSVSAMLELLDELTPAWVAGRLDPTLGRVAQPPAS